MNNNKKFFSEIESAFCWEGSARAKIETETDTELILKIQGSSLVEHSGDVDGIKSQVDDLKYQAFTEDNIIYTVLQATISIESEQRYSDDDYTVYVSGTVILSKR
jgi:hypothetical protein